MEGIRKICDENGILMICDEVQCGMGRTGNMFAWQGFGVKPDILTMAKAIGNGIPVGAFAMTEEVAKYSLQPGDHGATYGGNPLACTAVKKVIEIFEREDIVGHVNQVAPYLTKKLDELVDELDCVVKRKGKGLMQGIEITKPLAEVNKKTIEEGLLIIQAQGNVIRFVPPLIVEEKHIDEMIEKLNAQMNLELYSSLLYQQMSAWCSYHTFEGAAAFLRRHAQEEMTHMQRLFDYLTDTGNLPRINTVESPFAEYSSLDELFQETYKHEQLITQKINELAHAAMTNQDYPTFNFLQWYVSEQHEEEKLFKSFIDKLSLAGKSGEGLYFIDKELSTLDTQN